MDITSPSNLWKDYDVAALPLNKTSLTDKTENGTNVKELYFDGYTTVDGRVRAFIKIYENPQSRGTILFMSDRNGDCNDPTLLALLNNGYTVASLDYLGQSDSYTHYTLYPRSLMHCNSRGLTEFEADEEAHYSRWFVWTCMARRAVGMLKQMYDKPLFAVGVGLGGSTVYKLAAFDDGLTACATLLNVIPSVTGEGNSLINYHASLDNAAYATLCKVPLYMGVASNDADGSLDDMSELAEVTASLGCFRIAERTMSGGIGVIHPGLCSFFDSFASIAPILRKPTITASNSEKNLYFNITLGDEASEKAYKPELFVAFCIDDPRYRNWMNLKLIGLGENKYIAHINVCDNTKNIYAFANMTDEDGNIYSSRLFSVLPKAMGIPSSPGVGHRKIYDGSMGKDGWTSRNGGDVYVKQGLFGIDGITSDTNSLMTFKPGDPLFRVSADTLLQLMICGKPQSVNVIVSDNNNSYCCTVDLTSEDEWHKFSLSHRNFKGPAGLLLNWSNILTLEFVAEKEFIIGSVLWV